MDLRLPAGLLFLIVGAILTIVGLTGVALDLWWGLVELVFGALMTLFALRARRKTT
jgi:hypothetical protein